MKGKNVPGTGLNDCLWQGDSVISNAWKHAMRLSDAFFLLIKNVDLAKKKQPKPLFLSVCFLKLKHFGYYFLREASHIH